MAALPTHTVGQCRWNRVNHPAEQLLPRKHLPTAGDEGARECRPRRLPVMAFTLSWSCIVSPALPRYP